MVEGGGRTNGAGKDEGSAFEVLFDLHQRKAHPRIGVVKGDFMKMLASVNGRLIFHVCWRYLKVLE